MAVIVGLTGGIGSGKSTVAAMLEKLGATVVDADAIVHELQAPGEPLLDEIAAAFGPDVIDGDGALDREALGAVVFRDPAARQQLNRIVHPKVGAEFARRLQAARDAGVALIVLDIPLLFEARKAGTGGASAMDFDAIVLVWVPRETQIERQVERDGYGRDEAERRVAAQLPLDEKRSLADHVVDNSGSLEETERQVRELYATLVS
ncbi:MAG: dephospho-CoA kinase [Myxococcota bacterium]|nr:dephospho-CoA kinase [Myxococcota bacterium]